MASAIAGIVSAGGLAGATTLIALLAVPGVLSGQASSVLHIRVTLPDAAQTPTPVVRHALLISDNPATSEPRRVLTRVDGTVDVRLRPGSYTIESDRPVIVLGRAYQWTEMVDIVAGRDLTLELAVENAEVVPLPTAAPPTGAAAPGLDPSLLLAKWQESVVAVWSPTSRASGFVIDRRGLIATSRAGVGGAAFVAVQSSATSKVPARVLFTGRSSEVAIVWVDPRGVAAASPVPLPCPPAAAAPSLDDGQAIVALANALRQPVDAVSGEVTALQPLAVETDLRLSFGGAGGPVFDEAGAVVGLTSVPADTDGSRTSGVTVVRVGLLCEALSAAQSAMSGAPPEPTPLPVEPARPFPAEGVTDSPRGATAVNSPPVVSTSDFDVAFITPLMVQAAWRRADWTGGTTGRSPEAQARIGRLTDFFGWSPYVADVPPVVIVRVTPKLVEGLWKRLAREAARTQGAVLPPFTDFKASFLRMRVACGGAEVTPVHPFVIEHRVSENAVVREGLYVFHPDALGPHCGSVSLSLYSEKSPEKADTLTAPPAVIDRIWQDFAAYRGAGR
jgi:S1-C subfamily serine protease